MATARDVRVIRGAVQPRATKGRGHRMGNLVLYESINGVGTVTMNRPEQLNTMTEAFLEDLLTAMEWAVEDESARVVVLRGAGRAFCAGGDLREGAGAGVGDEGSVAEAAALIRRLMRSAEMLHSMGKVTIAAIRGACAGAGLSLACAADLRFASDTAVFKSAFVDVGLSGDFGGTWSLSRVVGPARARAAYLLSNRFAAAEALHIGLVSAVVADGDFDDYVATAAQRFADGPSMAFRLVKENLNDALRLDLDELLDLEAERFVITARTEDAKEATAAFLEKRAPTFRGL